MTEREFLVAVVSVFAINIGHSAEEQQVKVETSQKAETKDSCNFSARIDDLIKDNKVINVALANAVKPIICDLLDQTRDDQFDIYKAARAINRNVDSVSCQQDEKCVAFQQAVYSNNRGLIESSYSDQLHQNANLSDQIKKRLPFLLEDSLQLTTEPRRTDFLAELKVLTKRFLRSKRFRIGLGITNSYLPSLRYQGISSIDYSPFQSTIGGGSDRLLFSPEFSNESFLNLAISARVPFFQIDLTVPKFDDERNTITPVIFRDIDDTDRNILARSTINSKLDIEYEISVKSSVFEIYSYYFPDQEWPSKLGDLGVGIGLTGFRVRDDITTDIRFRTDGSTPFDDLMPSEMLTSNDKISFNSSYWIAYYAFDINDELRVGVDVRWYRDTNSSKGRVEVEDITVSVGAIWYPTFGKKSQKKQQDAAKAKE